MHQYWKRGTVAYSVEAFSVSLMPNARSLRVPMTCSWFENEKKLVSMWLVEGIALKMG
jgi:hypothetical protein